MNHTPQIKIQCNAFLNTKNIVGFLPLQIILSKKTIFFITKFKNAKSCAG